MKLGELEAHVCRTVVVTCERQRERESVDDSSHHGQVSSILPLYIHHEMHPLTSTFTICPSVHPSFHTSFPLIY
jgi:hypothetical protein